MITTALFATYLYENQFKQDVATDSAKNVLRKRLEGKKIETESLILCCNIIKVAPSLIQAHLAVTKFSS